MKPVFPHIKTLVPSCKLCFATRRFLHAFFFLTTFLLLSAKESGCRKRSGSEEFRTATELKKADYLVKKLHNQQRNSVKTMNAQAKIFMEGNGQSIGATANIIWIRDSVMWVNVKKFGLEAARALITKDSVFLLNRLEKTYSAQGLESLQRQYSLPAGFELLQSLLLAEPWYFPDIRLESDIKDGLHRLSGANGHYAADYRIEDQDFWLRQEIFVQPRDARTVSIGFEDHKKTETAGLFPYLRTVDAFSPETGDLRLSIELNKVEINVPKSFRFEIPSHYEKTK